jgi:hypothetical protein
MRYHPGVQKDFFPPHHNDPGEKRNLWFWQGALPLQIRDSEMSKDRNLAPGHVRDDFAPKKPADAPILQEPAKVIQHYRIRISNPPSAHDGLKDSLGL